MASNWPSSRRRATPPASFAGAKILSWAMNLTWLENAQQRGFDEAILLNERGEVAECTSANIFIANGNQAWTPRSAPAVCPASRAKSCSTKSACRASRSARSRCCRPISKPPTKCSSPPHARLAAGRGNRRRQSGPHAGCADRAGRGVPRAPPPIRGRAQASARREGVSG